MQDRSGEVLEGKYRLSRQIGAGGMGSVYVAEHLQIGKRVAVKLLHSELAGNPDAVRRFQQEARAAAAAGHRGIVEVHDVGAAADGTPYLVMELLDGESLGALLAREGSASTRFVVAVAVGALSALAAAHRKGVVHRDMKPDNVFLQRTLGDSPLVKILDFGVSKMSVSGVTGATRTGIALGTPHFMAPEQASGATDIDARVDVYAVGVILYQALTGAVPFDAPNYNALMLRVILEEPRPPRELRADLPEALETVILRAMAKQAQDRFRRAEEMIEALLPFLEGEDGLRTSASLHSPMMAPPALVAASVEEPTIPSARAATPMSWSTEVGRVLRTNWRILGPVAGVLVVAALCVGAWQLGSGEDVDTSVVEARWTSPSAAPSAGAAPVGFPPLVAMPQVPEIGRPAVGAPPPPVAEAFLDGPAWGPSGGAGSVEPRSPSLHGPDSGPEAAPDTPLPGILRGGQPAPDRRARAARSPASVRIKLSFEGREPAGARVFIEGIRIRGPPIVVGRSNVPIWLRVEAPGFVPFAKRIVPNRDQSVRAAMVSRSGS